MVSIKLVLMTVEVKRRYNITMIVFEERIPI